MTGSWVRTIIAHFPTYLPLKHRLGDPVNQKLYLSELFPYVHIQQNYQNNPASAFSTNLPSLWKLERTACALSCCNSCRVRGKRGQICDPLNTRPLQRQQKSRLPTRVFLLHHGDSLQYVLLCLELPTERAKTCCPDKSA